MSPYLEYRKSKCFEHKATVMLEDESNGNFSYAQMINYSDDGMLLGSDTLFELGTKMKIIFDKPLYKTVLKTYHVKVKWCNETIYRAYSIDSCCSAWLPSWNSAVQIPVGSVGLPLRLGTNHLGTKTKGKSP